MQQNTALKHKYIFKKKTNAITFIKSQAIIIICLLTAKINYKNIFLKNDEYMRTEKQETAYLQESCERFAFEYR